MNNMTETNALTGITEDELRAIAICPVCGKRVAETGELTFYRVQIEHCVLDIGALRNRAGLDALLGGNGPLGRVFGGNPDLAKIISGPKTVLIHENCALEPCVILRAMEDDEKTQGGAA